MKKISIVIVSYNSAKDLPECLESVYSLQSTDYSLQTIVVDNASSDDSVRVASEFNDVSIIKNKENLGFAGGNNLGIQAALKNGAEAILVLNPDTKLDQNLISELSKVADSNPKIGILSPKIYFYPGFEFHKERYKKEELGGVIWYAGGKIDWANVLASHRGVDEVDNGQYDQIGETDFASGAAMFVKKEVFKKTGYFNEKYFLYFEDVEFCQRAKIAGFQILYVPRALVWHKWAQTTEGGSKLQDYFFTRNRLLFGLSYVPLRSKIALLRQAVSFLFNSKIKRQAVIDFFTGRWGRGTVKL